MLYFMTKSETGSYQILRKSDNRIMYGSVDLDTICGVWFRLEIMSTSYPKILSLSSAIRMTIQYMSIPYRKGAPQQHDRVVLLDKDTVTYGTYIGDSGGIIPVWFMPEGTNKATIVDYNLLRKA